MPQQSLPNSIFTPRDVWHGGFYELALEIGTTSNDGLRLALTELWSYDKLKGCYLNKHKEPYEQQSVLPADVHSGHHYYGIARLRDDVTCACGSIVMRFDEQPTDWIHFYLPMAALSKVYRVKAFPFDDLSQHTDWQRELDTWLVNLARHVWSQASVRFGLVGFELSTDISSADIARHGVPATRNEGYLWPSNGELEYFPRNTD